MKRLLLLVTFTILCLFSFTQTNVQQDNRINPILRNALGARSGYYIYGRTNASGFINIAVLNDSSHTLCWFTCHGRLFDSTKLTVHEFEQVTSKRIDPFVLYQNICDKYLGYIAAAKDIYRVYGDTQLFDKLNGNYRALFAMETVQAAKTPLQKLIAIENVRKKILTQLAYLNCVSPFGLHDDPLYKISKEQAGAMIHTNDSTVYFNIDPTSAVAKISLYKKSAGQLYVQNRFSEIIDSVAIQPEKYDLLHKEKTDVFLLYRGWLELQWQGALSAIRRQSPGLYNQVKAQDEKVVKDLYSQLNAIGAKINQLNSPEAKSVEQAVYDTYKNETSEINYIPLLGIGYSLTQTRGQKEYELTNHLGNVLATVTDKKIGVSSTANSSLIDHYEPDIVSAQDYYPFGMLQPGRSYLSPNGEKYRYGFNGKENDNEVKGEGNQQDYGMRVYDPRLGKFLSVDPLYREYPWNSSYAFSENDVIRSVDLDGLEKVYHYQMNMNFRPMLVKTETLGPSSDESYTLTGYGMFGGGKTLTSKTYSLGDISVGRAQVARALQLSIYNATLDDRFQNVTTIEGLNELYAQRGYEERAVIASKREYDPENIANGFMALTIPLMMDVYGAQGGGGKTNSSVRNPGTGKVGVSGNLTSYENYGSESLDMLRMVEQPLNVKGIFSDFKNLSELAQLFKGKSLSNSEGELLSSGWSKVNGDWGSKSVFEKIIGKERYYAIWEPKNMEHSTNNLTTSYWKLTKNKINAFGENVKRVSDAKNFKQ